MKKDLMEILACPTCKGSLGLSVEEEKDEEIIVGSLSCAKCSESYPIDDSIPSFLPAELRQ